MARSRPYVILNAAMTLDGKIASRSGDSKISSKIDLERVHRLRTHVDAIVVGINTVLTDDPMLTSKNKRKNPVRVIIDSTARIKLTSKILRSCRRVPTIIAVSKRAKKLKLKQIKSLGATILTAGQNQVDLKKLFLMLKAKGVKRVLVEGGGKINWSMLSSGLVDEVNITVAPNIVGGRNAVTLVEGAGFARIKDAVKLRLQEIKKADNETVLFYKLIK